MSCPIVTIIGTENKSSDDIIKQILGGVEELPGSKPVIPKNEDFQGYSWKIDTKYYTANTVLLPLKDTLEKVPEEISNRVEAMIFYFDNTQLGCLDPIENMIKKLHVCNPEVLLLVCDKLPKENAKMVNGLSRNAILKWCTTNKFELIELQYEADDQEECIIKEKKGIARVIEALEAHTWMNMNIKDKPNTTGNALANNEQIEKLFDNILNEEGTDDFTELLAQLNTIKESVQSLSVNERRAGAEQVVAAFWRAIGGDEDEISGLEDL